MVVSGSGNEFISNAVLVRADENSVTDRVTFLMELRDTL